MSKLFLVQRRHRCLGDPVLYAPEKLPESQEAGAGALALSLSKTHQTVGTLVVLRWRYLASETLCQLLKFSDLPVFVTLISC